MGLARSFFTALAKEPAGTRTAVQEALGALAGAYKAPVAKLLEQQQQQQPEEGASAMEVDGGECCCALLALNCCAMQTCLMLQPMRQYLLERMNQCMSQPIFAFLPSPTPLLP